MELFDLAGHEFVELCDLLKLTAIRSSGGAAKLAVARIRAESPGGHAPGAMNRSIMIAEPEKLRKGGIIMSGRAEQKSFDTPDEVRTFPHGRVELVNIGNGTVGRLILEPGWRWSNDVKPIAGTDLCEAPHFQYVVSGRVHVVMVDGTEFDLKAGDVNTLPSGHDAWVVGDEPAVAVDWYGATNYAKA